MKNLILSIALFSTQISLGNESIWKEIQVSDMEGVYKKMELAYTTNEMYGFKSLHASYIGHETQVIHDQHRGYFHKSGDRYHSNILGVESVQGKDFTISIMKGEKAMMLTKNASLLQSFGQGDKELNLKRIHKIQTKKIGTSTCYRVSYKEGVSMEKIEIQVDDNGFMQKILLFYASKRGYITENGIKSYAKPRMEISYTKVPTSSFDMNEFETSNYVIEKNGELTVAPSFSHYQLNDLRIQN